MAMALKRTTGIVSDPIADMLTRIRNANHARRAEVARSFRIVRVGGPLLLTAYYEP